MSHSDEQFEQLWAYLDQELDAEAQAALEKVLFSDASLADACRERKTFNHAVSHLAREEHLCDEAMARLTQEAWERDLGIEPEDGTSTFTKRPPWLGLLAVAAALVLGFFSLSAFLPGQQPGQLQWAAPEVAMLYTERAGTDSRARADSDRISVQELAAVVDTFQADVTKSYGQRLVERKGPAPAWRLLVNVEGQGDQKLLVTIKGAIGDDNTDLINIRERYVDGTDFTNHFPDLQAQLLGKLLRPDTL